MKAKKTSSLTDGQVTRVFQTASSEPSRKYHGLAATGFLALSGFGYAVPVSNPLLPSLSALARYREGRRDSKQFENLECLWV